MATRFGTCRVGDRRSRLDVIYQPVEHVADRRLAGLDAEVAGDDAAVHDPANAGDVRELRGVHAHADVAGAGADDLHECAGLHARADRAGVRVERADGHGNTCRESGALGPVGGQRADCGIHGEHALRQTVAQRAELRVELGEKFLVGIAAPCRAIHRLVTGGADAGDELVGMQRVRQRGGNEVGQFNPAMCGIENFRRGAKAFQDFAEEPFARIGAAALDEVLRAHLLRERGDLGGFGDAGVILPQPRHRSRVVGELLLEHERLASRVHRERRAAGGVHADADDLAGVETFDGFLRRGERLLDGCFRAFQIVGGMLPRKVWIAREDDASGAVRITPDSGGDFRAVGDVDNEGANGVRAVVQADGVFWRHGFQSMFCKFQFFLFSCDLFPSP